MRGRNNGGNNNNNNNRKGPNPLTRNYESNGPDVKIRGSAQQIAEKYTTLARDATSSGDRVMAENYLQHAEHYNRIIAAAQAQMPIQQIPASRDDLDDMDDEEQFGFEGNVNGGSDHAPAPQQHQQPNQAVPSGTGPQPDIEGVPAEVALNQEAGQPQGNRFRERRPFQPGGEQQTRSEGNGEDGAGRRGRRSRRGGERNRNEDGANGQEAGAAGDAQQQLPVGESTSDGAEALAAFEN